LQNKICSHKLGYGGTFSDPNATYDQEDREADEMWANIDAKMDRRKRRREDKLKQEIEKYRQVRPKIQQLFADAKSALSEVTSEEWDNLPDPGDNTKRHTKKQPNPRFGFMPVPDSVLEKNRTNNEYNIAVEPEEVGSATPMGDLTQIGEARKSLLSLNLKKMSDSVGGQTNVDPKGYLTNLATVKIASEAEIGDLKKARLLLKSVRTTNPKHAPGWIASARLEEVAGKILAARKLIQQACQSCPESDDVWIEAARLHTPENAKAILAKAIQHVPKSVKVWLQATQLETETKAKKRVLRKALEMIPNSVKLWKAAIELEETDDARVLLTRAVECVPHSVEMWLALARLESYENARKVLNKARETIPTDPQIWITAANLEEANGNIEGVKLIIKRTIKSLTAHQVVIDREQWIKEAENAERNGAVGTCQAIIKETIAIGVEDEDRKRTWMDDAEARMANGCLETARAIYAHALTVFPNKKSLWLRVAHLEKNHGTKDALDAVLREATKSCPKSEVLWLMAAKEKWLSNDVAGARDILQRAFAENPNSEQIWLAAVKLENENNERDKARALLKRARERASTERVWLKSAELEREAKIVEAERQLLDEALVKYPQFAKFWMMRGQLEERTNRPEVAREVYQKGIKNCPNSVAVWMCQAALEEKTSPAKARSLLEKARLMNPKSPELWLAAVRVERRANNLKTAQQLLAKGLQDCPTNGVLWAETIEMEPANQKKAKSVEALKRCDNDPCVIVAVAKLFWADKKVDKARTWFNRAVTINPDYGDAWAHYYKFEVQHGTEDQQKEVLKRAVEAEPHHGELWIKVSKDLNNTRFTPEQTLKKVAAGIEFYL
jgi:pre-mRNA-processing factor 6